MLHLDAALSIAMECLHCDASSDRCCLVIAMERLQFNASSDRCCLVGCQQLSLLERSAKKERGQARLETVPGSLLRVQSGLTVCLSCLFFLQV